MTEEKDKKVSDRDEELDIAHAIDKVQDILRKIVGNLSNSQFKLELVKQNGSNTRYIIISSVIPDLGQERDYYFMKVDVESGKIVLPIGKGKLIDGAFQFQEIEVNPDWEK